MTTGRINQVAPSCGRDKRRSIRPSRIPRPIARLEWKGIVSSKTLAGVCKALASFPRFPTERPSDPVQRYQSVDARMNEQSGFAQDGS